MDDQVAPPSVEDSHLNILPVYPARVIVPLFEPEHAEVVTAGETVPPTGTGETVIVPVKKLLTQVPVVVTV